MTHWRKYLCISLTSAVAGAGFLLVAPHRGEAQYATPVRVTNTSSAPAIGSLVDDPGRIPYTSAQSSNATSPTDFQSFTFSPVPANHRLVVTNITGQISVTTANTPVALHLFGQGGFDAEVTAPPTNGVNGFTAPVLNYIDAGSAPVVWAFSSGGGLFTGPQYLGLIGYMLDCSAAPCAPIAH